MSFIIPEEELTTEGPYSIGAVRRLSPMEVAYTELILQMELLQAQEDLAAYMPTESPSDADTRNEDSIDAVGFLRHPVANGIGAQPVALPTPNQGAVAPQALGVQADR